MDDRSEQQAAELLLALAACPAGRATPADLAERVGWPLGVVSRGLRHAQQRGLVGSTITLADQRGHDRVFWLSGRAAGSWPGLGTAPAEEGQAMTIRVFLVDDSATARRMLRLVLGEVPGIVFVGEASSGEQALARVGEARPDVVVMDWQMPGINGVEATARVLDDYPSVRVVGFTSSGDAGTHRAFVEAGAAAVFHKEDALALRGWLEALLVG